MTAAARRLVALAALLALHACAPLVDAERARLCRIVIPAINEAGTRASIIRVGNGPGQQDLTIDYRATAPDGAIRNRLVVCRFADDAVSTQRNDMRGIATEDGPMAEASFLLLKRFYLADPANAALDPAPPTGFASAAAPQVPFPLAYGAQFVVSAIPSMAIYGLLAAAYALLFGLVGRVILGYGEFAAIGGASTLLVATGIGSVADPPVALIAGGVAGLVAAGLHGLVTGRLVVARIARAPGQQVLIATVGLSLALSEYVRLTQGAVTAWLAPVWNRPIVLLAAEGFTTTITPIVLLIAGIGLVAASALVVTMRLTPFGRSWRAYADDALAAALMGIDGGRLIGVTFGLACGLAGLAGVLVSVLFGAVGFTGGFAIGLKALIAAVVGGIGSIGGAFLGGIVVAAIEVLWVVVLPVESRDITLYALLIVFLVFRPQGLMGKESGQLPR